MGRGGRRGPPRFYPLLAARYSLPARGIGASGRRFCKPIVYPVRSTIPPQQCARAQGNNLLMQIEPAEGTESPARLLLIDGRARAGEELAPVLSACLARPSPIDIAVSGRRAVEMLREQTYPLLLAERS